MIGRSNFWYHKPICQSVANANERVKELVRQTTWFWTIGCTFYIKLFYIFVHFILLHTYRRTYSTHSRNDFFSINIPVLGTMVVQYFTI
jgi:uncharacterized membrane protein (DUF485 family)